MHSANRLLGMPFGLRLVGGGNALLIDDARATGEAAIRVEVPSQDSHQLVGVDALGRRPVRLDLARNRARQRRPDLGAYR